MKEISALSACSNIVSRTCDMVFLNLYSLWYNNPKYAIKKSEKIISQARCQNPIFLDTLSFMSED